MDKERTTAPQSPYTISQVIIGIVVFVIGIFITLKLPIIYTYMAFPSFLDLLTWGIYLFIIGMFAVALLVIFGIFPESEDERVFKIDNRPNSDWESTIRLKTESAFVTNQPLTVDIELETKNEGTRDMILNDKMDPEIEFLNASTSQGYDAIIPLDHKNGIWNATEEIVYRNPGYHQIDYRFVAGNDREDIGEIDTERKYLEYKNQRYILLLTITTAIIAAGSLLVAIQTI